METTGVVNPIGWVRAWQPGIAKWARLAVAQRHCSINYQSLTESANDMIYTLDLDMRLTYINGTCERVTGYTPAELKRLGLDSLIAPEQLGLSRAMWQHKLAGTHRTIYELDVVARDGRRLTLEVNTSLLKWRGRVEGVQGIARDITEHKCRTEELRQATDAAFAAMRAKNTLLTNTGHELRTPLTIILGTAEFLREHANGLSIPALTDRLTAIDRAAQRLRTVIANLIDLSAIEAGQRVQQAEDFAVCEILTEIAARLQATLNLHENRLVIDCAATERMFTDRSKLRAIMFNLLDYAAKATQHDELRLEVSVLLHNGAPWLNFLIADSEAGRSCSPLDLDFDDLSLTTGIAATQSVDDDGLGLPLANYYCQLLGGYLLINNAPGRSARFEVRLPQVAISE